MQKNNSDEVSEGDFKTDQYLSADNSTNQTTELEPHVNIFEQKITNIMSGYDSDDYGNNEPVKYPVSNKSYTDDNFDDNDNFDNDDNFDDDVDFELFGVNDNIVDNDINDNIVDNDNINDKKQKGEFPSDNICEIDESVLIKMQELQIKADKEEAERIKAETKARELAEKEKQRKLQALREEYTKKNKERDSLNNNYLYHDHRRNIAPLEDELHNPLFQTEYNYNSFLNNRTHHNMMDSHNHKLNDIQSKIDVLTEILNEYQEEESKKFKVRHDITRRDIGYLYSQQKEIIQAFNKLVEYTKNIRDIINNIHLQLNMTNNPIFNSDNEEYKSD